MSTYLVLMRGRILPSIDSLLMDVMNMDGNASVTAEKITRSISMKLPNLWENNLVNVG